MGKGREEKGGGADRDVLRGLRSDGVGVRWGAGYLQRYLDEGAREVVREDDGAQGGVDEGFEVALADACVRCPVPVG